MTKPRYWVFELTRVALPLAFVSLVAAAVAGISSPLFFAILFSAGLVIVVVRALFPTGRLFPVAFASLIAVYAAIFSLFVEEVFRGIARSCPSNNTQRAEGHARGGLASAGVPCRRCCHPPLAQRQHARTVGHAVPWSHFHNRIDCAHRQSGRRRLLGRCWPTV